MTREELFLSQVTLIERMSSWVCARRGLRGADADDFRSVVTTRLIEDDYEILARFEGRSSLKTYLAAVINHFYLDFQTQRFGKWRPSAEARRLGPVALHLERLLFHDALSFDEACGVLGNDPGVRETREALHALRARLPHRADRSVEPAQVSDAESGLSVAERSERQALAERTFAAIGRSVAQLPARDRIFLRLHFESGFTVADAARSLGLEQKMLYRRKEFILDHLRSDLAADGIRSEDAHELLASLDWSVALASEEPENVPLAEKQGPRPSQRRDPATRRDGEP